MSEFNDIAALHEIPKGGIRGLTVAGRRIVVARTEKGIYAIDDVCPHRGGPLSDGDVSGCEIICPWHFWGFDLRTGRHTGGSRFAVVTHEVRIENDRVLVRLSPPIEPAWMV